MTLHYDSQRFPLRDVIQEATHDATYVIPDLQRPYVWTPRQVTLLVDSLFRGWPFGSLLLWEVKPDCFGMNEGIPHRPFWEVVDRAESGVGTQASPLAHPATYRMVLDGQQRVQSLVLALGGDNWGFVLPDHAWSEDLHDKRVKPTAHWSRGSLCLDLQKFASEVRTKNDTVRKLEIAKILDWVVLESSGESNTSRPASYEPPLRRAFKERGRFIRLSRLWRLAQADLSEREYRARLKETLQAHDVSSEQQNQLLLPLAEFMKVVEGVKYSSDVHALQVSSFVPTAEWTKDDYSDAIVNIFTRLNTAGRTLTREEITLAWLKVGWVRRQKGDRTAGECLDDLKNVLADSGFSLEIDEIVRLISFVWSVAANRGQLLDAKDLLRGDVIRPMAEWVSTQWGELALHFEQGAKLLRARDLVENTASFNAVIVYLAWAYMVFSRFASLRAGLRVVESDSLNKNLEERAGSFVDRWLFGSQWANVWAEGAARNFQDFAQDLHESWNIVKACNADQLLALTDQAAQKLMTRVVPKAIETITSTLARDRRQVHIYYPFLWVWHRLEADRWERSSIPMRTGRARKGKLEVDHAVAGAWWQRLVNRVMEQKITDFENRIKTTPVENPDDERAQLAPDGFASRWEASSFINLLGNCSLLDKSFNVSKSDSPMWEFLQRVHEFQKGTVKREEWERALSLSAVLTDPSDADITTLVRELLTRDRLIREELVRFMQGSMARVDIVP